MKDSLHNPIKSLLSTFDYNPDRDHTATQRVIMGNRLRYRRTPRPDRERAGPPCAEVGLPGGRLAPLAVSLKRIARGRSSFVADDGVGVTNEAECHYLWLPVAGSTR